MRVLRIDVVKDEEEAMEEYDETREADDVAETPASVYLPINIKLRLNKDHYFDICKLNPLFEKRKDYDSDI